jgi:hypothetical protein
MRRLADGIGIAAALLAGMASSLAMVGDDNYSVSGGQGNTTVKSPDVPVAAPAPASAPISNGSNISSDALYNASRSGNTNYDAKGGNKQ